MSAAEDQRGPPARYGLRVDDRTAQAIGLSTDGYFGGARLLVSDARVAWLLLNEVRCQAIQRVFGVPRDQANVVTIIALGTLAAAAQRRVQRVVTAPGRPTLGGTLFGMTMAKDSAHALAGDWSRDTPMFSTLLAIVVAGTLSRPVAKVLFHDVRAAAHRARTEFDHRYGHLMRRNRSRRAS